jgi:hypothetical protein
MVFFIKGLLTRPLHNQRRRITQSFRADAILRQEECCDGAVVPMTLTASTCHRATTLDSQFDLAVRETIAC